MRAVVHITNPDPRQTVRLTVEGPSGARHAGPFSRLIECCALKPGQSVHQSIFTGQRLVIEPI